MAIWRCYAVAPCKRKGYRKPRRMCNWAMLQMHKGDASAVISLPLLVMTPACRDIPHGLHHPLTHGDVLIPAVH